MTSNEIKEIRKGLGLNQTQFAKKMGVSLRTIQNWESDNYEIPYTVTQKVRNLNESLISEESEEYVDPKKKIITIDGVEFPILRLVLAFMKHEEDFMKIEEFRTIIDYRIAKGLSDITESADTLREYLGMK